ncbi:Quinoprotein glucose dehydrogenase B precursor [Planctomycetes bacterium Poly30]|uniref:Quinoprotein glucose dehydrogenase B n=1 Tax=Saltatorellus ferox TaxID=2528018 RepID=A0A518ESX5_9BACT|nr:Quinoprotein glucose dehydrogenase B precursor [Planctomycetes bacterium Poly30]
MRHLSFYHAAALVLCSGVAAGSCSGFPGSGFPASGPELDSGVDLRRFQPSLRFERPVFLTGAGDRSGRLFVVEQSGVIRVFDGRDEAREAEVFLDISEHVSRAGNEEGLLGLAFHPDYATNGEFFVHFSSTRDADDKGVARNVISRFRVDPENPRRADESSEETLLMQRQPYRNHNGGDIAFGPDGMLYASFGDGGAANDPEGNGQKLTSILGSIIRIDVDSQSDGLAYGIPADNPFVEVEGARPEIWAIGLRNVWRFSFDLATGELFAGDVGQNKIEEVDIIVRGGNYGWNRYEANDDFAKETKLVAGEHIAPIASYPHSEGLSITGGYVYRGTKFPELRGAYFFADYVSGNLWATTRTEDGGFETALVRRTGRSISSFGEDDAGELYVTSFDGGLYQVVGSDEAEKSLEDWPALLSEAGLYSSMQPRVLSSHLIPYEVNAPFWSDGAEKARFIELPEGAQLGYREDGSWDVPVGARIVKTFDDPPAGRRKSARPLETRVIKRTESGWEAATYVWNGRGTEAELRPAGRQFERYTSAGVTSWHAPSSSECASCHVAEAGYVLGLATAQLNRGEAEDNQIARWIAAGHVAGAESFDAAGATRYCAPYGDEGSLEERARVYLDVNCAMCHRPNGPGNANIDLRFGTELANTGMIGAAPTQGSLGVKDAKVVAPGSPASSLLLHRVETLGAGRMPTIGSNVVDRQAVNLLTCWIASMQ